MSAFFCSHKSHRFTLFFGWLPLYLPEMFPTPLRATGTGVAYNSGRFLTAGGVLIAGKLIEAFHGDYAGGPDIPMPHRDIRVAQRREAFEKL